MQTPPPPPLPLPEELVENILFRLPPDSPASLIRAGVVCKLWCQLVSDPVFQHRFREFHRSPPMLGFLYDHDYFNSRITRFVPTSAFFCRPHTGHRGMRPCDSRHGRVLLHHAYPKYRRTFVFDIVVWDPITDLRLELPQPPPAHLDSWTAAVLCDAAHNGACNHLDCHGGPFTVVLVGTRGDKIFSYIYSSEAGSWSGPTSATVLSDHVSWKRSALVGNLLYFVSASSKRIIEYDFSMQKVSVTNLPDYMCKNKMCEALVELTTTADNRLGLTRVEDYRLCLWSREVDDARWALSKVIDLGKLLPLDGLWTWATKLYLVGSAEGVGVIFLMVKGELYTIDLRSDRLTMVHLAQRPCIDMVVPYMSFYTPGISYCSPNERYRTNACLFVLKNN
ncbi:unnamed protein product [Urochloa decumbens]|uniref:F-box domain-containing protein n=1 Tax=Urochloa decumbens TaxID=240449 RepID=A0ABC9FLU8_9POAL